MKFRYPLLIITLCTFVYTGDNIITPVYAGSSLQPPNPNTNSSSNPQFEDRTIYEYKDMVFDHMTNFVNDIHPNFGYVKYVTEPIYHWEDQIIYDSFWNATEPPTYKPYLDTRFDVYKFEKKVDIPVEIFHTRRLLPHTSSSFTIQNTASNVISTTDVIETASTIYTEFSLNNSYYNGSSIDLRFIGGETGFGNDIKVLVGSELFNKVQNVRSKTTTFQTIYTETFNFDNSNLDIPRYFQLNYRQRFDIYFVTTQKFNYLTKEWGSGLFNADKNYDYIEDNYTFVCTNFILIPTDSPYFEMSIYCDNSDGIRKYLYNDMSSVYFI